MTADRDHNAEALISNLIGIMAALRTPLTGCPWDLEQTFKTIAPYTIEEAYEVADAIERSDLEGLKDELGDLLLQVVYHSRMAEEAGAFQFSDTVQAVIDKMIRRHPHVFGTQEQRAQGAAPGFWNRMKAAEKSAKPKDTDHQSLLDGVGPGMPGLTRAIKLQDKAAQVGFDWPQLAPVFEKLKEEIAEFQAEALPLDPRGDDAQHPHAPMVEAKVFEEFGDILFVMANVARHLKIDPEAALRSANQKFIRRFHHIEKRLHNMGRTPQQSTLEEMDELWDEAKFIERS